MTNNRSILLSNIDKIHTTKMGFDRIRKNLQLQTEDVVGWCIKLVVDKKSVIIKKGKNWYVTIDDIEITVNVNSYTIITAHIIGNHKT